MTGAQLRDRLIQFVDKTNITGRAFDFINMAIREAEEAHNYRCMQVRKEHSLSDGDYSFTNPITNYKALINAHLYDAYGYRYTPLKRVSQEYATKKYPDYDDSKGRPLYISEITSVETTLDPDTSPPTFKWLIRPTADGSYTMEINAYQYTPALDDVTYTTNWWTQNKWMAILTGALKWAYLYLGDENLANTYNNIFMKTLNDIKRSDSMERLSGSEQHIEMESGDYEPFDIDNL